MLLKPSDYIEYLISTQINYTCSYLVEHKRTVSDFLYHAHLSSQDLWRVVAPHLEKSENAMIIVDDSVQQKPYARFMELVKRQYCGNTKSVVNGIGLVNRYILRAMMVIFILLIIVYITLKVMQRVKMSILGRCL